MSRDELIARTLPFLALAVHMSPEITRLTYLKIATTSNLSGYSVASCVELKLFGGLERAPTEGTKLLVHGLVCTARASCGGAIQDNLSEPDLMRGRGRSTPLE